MPPWISRQTPHAGLLWRELSGVDAPRCDGAAALVSAPRTSTSRSSTISALMCGRPMGFCWGALLTKSVRRLDDESVVRAPTRRSLAAFGLCTSAPRIPHAAHMPAQPLGRKGHVLSSTFVGVARQAQWFDEQAGEKTPRCRTIGPDASCSGCASGRLPAAAATTLRSSLPLRVCMPSRVREAEGVGEAVEGDCTGGWRAGCWPRETCGQRRVGEAAPWASWTRVVPRAMLASLRGGPGHVPEVAGTAASVVSARVVCIYISRDR